MAFPNNAQLFVIGSSEDLADNNLNAAQDPTGFLIFNEPEVHLDKDLEFFDNPVDTITEDGPCGMRNAVINRSLTDGFRKCDPRETNVIQADFLGLGCGDADEVMESCFAGDLQSQSQHNHHQCTGRPVSGDGGKDGAAVLSGSYDPQVFEILLLHQQSETGSDLRVIGLEEQVRQWSGSHNRCSISCTFPDRLQD